MDIVTSHSLFIKSKVALFLVNNIQTLIPFLVTLLLSLEIAAILLIMAAHKDLVFMYWF